MKRYRLSIDIESDTDPATWEPSDKLILDKYEIVMYMDLDDLDDAVKRW